MVVARVKSMNLNSWISEKKTPRIILALDSLNFQNLFVVAAVTKENYNR